MAWLGRYFLKKGDLSAICQHTSPPKSASHEREGDLIQTAFPVTERMINDPSDMDNNWKIKS
jgi:hypothetical protein